MNFDSERQPSQATVRTACEHAAAAFKCAGIQEAVAAYRTTESALSRDLPSLSYGSSASEIAKQLTTSLQGAVTAMKSPAMRQISMQLEAATSAMRAPIRAAYATSNIDAHAQEVLAAIEIPSPALQALKSIKLHSSAQEAALALAARSPFIDGAHRSARLQQVLGGLTQSCVQQALDSFQTVWPVQEWVIENAETLAAEREAERAAAAEDERSEAIEGVLTATPPGQAATFCPFAVERLRREASARARRGVRTAPRRRAGGRSPTSSGSSGDPPGPSGPHAGGLGSGDWSRWVCWFALQVVAGAILQALVLDGQVPLWRPLALVVFVVICRRSAVRKWRARHARSSKGGS